MKLTPKLKKRDSESVEDYIDRYITKLHGRPVKTKKGAK